MDSTQDNDQEASERPEEISNAPDADQQNAAPAPDQELPQSSRDEALAAIRRDLRDEEQREASESRGFKRLMQRIFRRKRAAAPETTDAPSRLDELDFPEPPAARMAASSRQTPVEPAATEATTAAPAPEQGKRDFEALVRNRLGEAFDEKVHREPLEMEPAAPVEEEQQYPAAPGHSILNALHQDTETEPQQPVDFRQEALEGYEMVSSEPDEEAGVRPVRRIKQSWRYMHRTEKRLLIGALIIIGLAVLAGSGFLVVKSIPTPTVAVTPTTPVEPIPISVSLPGGWVFPLSVGVVQNAQWNPKGPEWLSGTEVCRWVSLPWTVQLEAVLRTLKANDPIQLSMSNYDSIIYKVQSIEQVPAPDIKKLASDSPCLLLILSKENTDNRWVVTAKP